MQKRTVTTILTVLILAVIYFFFQEDEEANATFLRVVDGDTFLAEIDGEEEYVRLLLVDTPELDHKAGNHQPFAEEASARMADSFDKFDPIFLEYGTDERDRYDRVLAYLYTKDDELFNELLIKEGLARVAYVFPPNDKYASDFYKAESEARNKKIGVWSISNYVTNRGFQIQ
ncbi:thermonuclease family protein [Oceanobacillus alkalisoli]|uniref:thermonuclease family protein n=1 Tax=Oceanobacillus alkalisoli TaxID=2925113 RepID=UPI001EE499A9|nr:thermonuclease family protein [Oceanobacillus alkalisoli]MCG5104366.1 thermonuclease family protein [Oceanobacillus alkalisoli]